jgi:hypothetical protein
METKPPIPAISLNTQDLLCRKVADSNVLESKSCAQTIVGSDVWVCSRMMEEGGSHSVARHLSGETDEDHELQSSAAERLQRPPITGPRLDIILPVRG